MLYKRFSKILNQNNFFLNFFKNFKEIHSEFDKNTYCLKRIDFLAKFLYSLNKFKI